MKKDLSNYRKSYQKDSLRKSDIDNNPFNVFGQWFKEVDTEDYKFEANAMTLSTIDLDGFPRNRVVLLKEYSEDGFIFYTNYKSQKGQAINNNNNVCLSFFWQQSERQVIIKGEVEKISEEKSTDYFHSRPRGSQLGAAVSNQSRLIANRETLEKRLAILKRDYENQEIPKPEDWGGYLVVPVEFEFWQGRDNRLHDRIRFSDYEKGKWKISRLQP